MTPIEQPLGDPNNPDYAAMIQATYNRPGSATEIANLAGMDYGTAQGILNDSMARWNASHPAVDQSGIATLNTGTPNTNAPQPTDTSLTTPRLTQPQVDAGTSGGAVTNAPTGMVNSAHQGPVTDVPAATPQQKQIIDWMASQNDPMNQQVIADNWARAGIDNPYTNPAILKMAQDAADKAARSGQAGAWEDPNWKNYLGTNKEAYTTAKQVLADPAFAKQFAAQNNLAGSNLTSWLQNALDPYGAAVQRAGTPSSFVAGGGGGAQPGVIRRPGEAITAGEKFSHQYTPDEMTGLNALWDKYHNDPAAMKQALAQYGATPEDIGLLKNISKSQLTSYFGDTSKYAGDPTKSKNLAGLDEQSLGAKNAYDMLDTQGRREFFSNWAKQNGVNSMTSPSMTSRENNFTPWGTEKPLTIDQSYALDASWNKAIKDYNEAHPFTPFKLGQQGLGSLVTANALNKPDVGRPDVGTPVKDVPAPSSANTPVMSAQDFATQYTSLQNNKDAKPEEWTSFLSSALANPDIKKAYGDKLIPAYQTLNTQQFSQSLLADPYASGTDLQKQIKTMMDDPAAKEKYGDKLQAIYDKAGTTQSGWYGGKQYDSLNPLAVDNIYNQLKAQQTALGTDKLMQGGALRGGDGGFGSVDAVTMDMAKNLAASGITDIKQVGQGTYYQPTPVTSQLVDANGQQVQQQNGKYYVSVADPNNPDEAVLKQVDPSTLTKQMGYLQDDGEGGSSFTPLTADQQKQLKTDKNGNMTVPVAAGEGIINKATGEKLASNYSERTRGPMWSGTFKGDGNTGYGVQFDPATGTPVFFTRGASSADLGPISAALGIASFIPGVAPFAMAANAALSASQGNWLGALASGIGAFGGAGGIGNMLGASADTLANLDKLKSGISLANAVNNKDLLGTLTSGSSLAGMNLGDMKLGDNFSVKDLTGGLSIANALKNGDMASLINAAAQMSGSKDAVTALQGINLLKAINSGSPAAMSAAIAKLNASQTASTPPGKAAGGLLHGPAPVKVPHSMTSVDPRMFQGVAANLLARRA